MITKHNKRINENMRVQKLIDKKYSTNTALIELTITIYT